MHSACSFFADRCAADRFAGWSQEREQSEGHGPGAPRHGCTQFIVRPWRAASCSNGLCHHLRREAGRLCGFGCACALRRGVAHAQRHLCLGLPLGRRRVFTQAGRHASSLRLWPRAECRGAGRGHVVHFVYQPGALSGSDPAPAETAGQRLRQSVARDRCRCRFDGRGGRATVSTPGATNRSARRRARSFSSWSTTSSAWRRH